MSPSLVIKRPFYRRWIDRVSGRARGGEFYRLIVESIEDYAVFTTDPAGKITSWNPGAMKVFGFSEEEIIGRPARLIFTPEDIAQGIPEKELSTAFQSGRASDERWHIRKTGHRFWASGVVFSLLDPAGKNMGFVKVVRDETILKEAQEAVRSSAEQLRILTDAVPGLISYIDAGRRYVFVNRAYEEWLARPKEEIVGKTIEELSGSVHYETIRPSIERALSGERTTFQTQFSYKGLEQRWVKVDYTPHLSQDGVVAGLVAMITDISELKHAEQQIRKSEERLAGYAEELERAVADRTKMLHATVEDLESFSYTVSHDLRSPVRALQGYAYLLFQKLSEAIDPESKAMLAKIAEVAARLDRLIQDLLFYSAIPRMAAETAIVDLDAALKHVVEHYPELKNARIEVIGRLGQVRSQESLLIQVLSNLLSNAVKFARPGTEPVVRVWAEQQDSRVRLSIEDDGIGIPPEHQEKIFDPFVKLHPKEAFPGTGIGLAIVKKSTERMGGRVGVESAPGKGSRFWVELPGPL